MTRNPDLVLREIYGKTILMPIRYNEASNEPIYLNDVAAQIWKMAFDAENCYKLQKAICDTYRIREDSAEAYSVENFIRQLMDKKLIFD